MKNKKLIHGDCLDKKVLDQIEIKADIVFTSPPYNLGKGGDFYREKFHKGDERQKTKKYKTLEADKNKDWGNWIIEFVKTYLDKAEYVFLNLQKLSSNKKDIHKILYKLNDYFCDEIIWNKSMGIPCGFQDRIMTSTHETIYIFSKKPTRKIGTKYWKGNKNSCVSIGGNRKSEYAKLHKAVMGQDFSDYIIDNFVKDDGVVIDPMMGLGTTGVSCMKYGKKFIGIEIEKDYLEIARKRLEEVK